MIRLDMLGTLSLRGTDGRELRSVLAQPKRLALLAYLAAESARGFQRRDRLFALFWPELNQAQARQALRQSLYFLRRAVGEHVLANRGAEEIGIAPGTLRSDVCEFTELLDAHRLEDALVLYRGDLLTGFFIADASPEFEQWLDGMRVQLRQRAADAAWKLAEADERRGRASEAAHWARYAARLAPEDERTLQRLVALLDRQGDRAGALRAYAEFAERLATELDVEPSAETQAMIEGVRSRACPSTVAAAAAKHPPGRAAAIAAGPAARDAAATDPASAHGAPHGTGHEIAPELAPDIAPEIAPAVAPEIAAVSPRPAPPAARDVSEPANEMARDRVAHSASGASPRRTWWRRRSHIAVGAAALAIVVAAAAAASARLRRGHPPPVVAVGWVQDPSGADTASRMRTFAELLTSDLGRVPGLRVVSHARLYDILSQLGVREETPSAISEAARRAGAGELLEAVLSSGPNHTVRLDLRRVDLATGASGPERTFEAPTVFDLADRATAQVAVDFDLRAPARPLSQVTTTSLAAERLYDEGLRAYYRSDMQTAVQLFHAALDQDSTFAMAAYYAGRGEEAADGLAARRDLELALHLAGRSSDRERLIIRQTWAFETNNPTQLALAESLVARYPDEPGAELALGRAAGWSGDFVGAIPHLQRAIHLDSLSLAGRSPWCRACEALDLLLATYRSLDSLDATERVAHAWTRMQPRAAGAWWALADVFAREERYDSALAAEGMAERVAGNGFDYVIPRVVIAIRSGAFAAADAMLASRVQNGNPTKRGEALWWLVISLRYQGRLGEALAAAERMVRTTADEPPSLGLPRPIDPVAVAQVLFEMGRFRDAAALFDSIANYDWQSSPRFPRDAPGLFARHRIWMTTHEATALAAARDTARLAAVTDSLEAWAPRSAYVRDRVLYHYARGLLLESRGASRDAERELRRALVTPIDGYSRVNLELGKLLLSEGRAREAIPLLQAPLHGSVESSNYYLPYTDLHALLATAFDRAGEPDSAVVHYRRALTAWRHADPAFRPRIEAIERRLRALDRPRTGDHLSALTALARRARNLS